MRQFKWQWIGIFSLIMLVTNSAWALKIGVVDLNRALNESEEGIRSKNILESKGRQKQQDIKLEEEELKTLADELSNNPLLNPETKRQKEEELRQRQQNLRGKIQQFQQDIRTEERRLTEEIFKELKTVIRSVSITEKFDVVLEKNAAEVILYMKEDKDDFTQKIIDRYNALKAEKH
ncbi:MAG: OmpH family outer membrane protein [SAR324 cluster bacterium]|nr:OmpH family outer membrane protein [SAR324 cluster bacterium]